MKGLTWVVVVFLLIFEYPIITSVGPVQSLSSSLSAFSRVGANIDGILGATEWGQASKVNFSGWVSTWPSFNGTIYEMNDATYLYLGLQVALPSHNDTAASTSVYITFDNGSVSTYQSPLDQIGYSGTPEPWWNGSSTYDGVAISGDGVCCVGYLDSQFGGTNDVVGAATSDGRYAYVEIRHPLCSGDSSDFCLQTGERVNFYLLISTGSSSAIYPLGRAIWKQIIIAGPVPFRPSPPPLSWATSVVCGSSYISTGGEVSCSATVTGYPSAGYILWIASGPGNVTISPSICPLVSGKCVTSVVGVTPGAVHLQAYYSAFADIHSYSDSLSSSSVPLDVFSVGVTCKPVGFVVGTTTSCRAIVKGNSLKGQVIWSSSSPGQYSTPSCILRKGSCSTRFKALIAGSSVNVTATYHANSTSPTVAGVLGLSVSRKATRMIVTCRHLAEPFWPTMHFICTASVSGFLPSGNLTWSQAGGTGSVSLSSATCALAKGTCSVTMTGTTAGKVILQAKYSGDPNNQSSSRTATLTVK